MTDELNSQLSAFIDDALSAEESELLVRRLCRDPQLRTTVARYALIGEALGARETAVSAPADFSRRIMLSVEGQAMPAAVARPGRIANPRHRVGMAIAASAVLAALALLLVPGRAPDNDAETTLASVSETVTPAPEAALTLTTPTLTPLPATAREYTVPVTRSQNIASAAQRAKLNNLYVRHLNSTPTQSGVRFRNVGLNQEVRN